MSKGLRLKGYGAAVVQHISWEKKESLRAQALVIELVSILFPLS